MGPGLMKPLQDTRDLQMVIKQSREVENARKLRDVDFINKVQKMVDENSTIPYDRMN